MNDHDSPGDYAQRFHHDVPLTDGVPALVLVDLQHASASRDHGLGAALAAAGREAEGAWRFDRIEQVVVPNVTRLLAAARRRGVAVVHVALGSRTGSFDDVPPYLRPILEGADNRVGAPNHRFLPAVTPADGEQVVTKSTADAFIGTDLDDRLRRAGVETLFVAGVSTNSCVESTARHAADLGYGVVLVEDACAAASEPLHAGAVRNLARLFVDVGTTDDAVATFSR